MLKPGGEYKQGGKQHDGLSWTVKGCRFEAGELDPHVPEIRRLPAAAPIFRRRPVRVVRSV
jgi:hypothetical protein